MTHASGTFTVTLAPLPIDAQDDGWSMGRLSIDKVFHGELEATSKGEMLSVSTDTKGSAGYVAFERVTGALDGRTGSFVLQHSGIMDRGTPRLDLNVVPDSGTAALTGLTGTMRITVAAGAHSYAFEYDLPLTNRAPLPDPRTGAG